MGALRKQKIINETKMGKENINDGITPWNRGRNLRRVLTEKKFRDECV